MYYIETDLDKKSYLKEVKRCFRNPFLLFDERICGIVIGPFFSVAYHSPYEWNRRITSECNRAWGIVKQIDGKTEVNYLLGKGLLSPFWLLFYAFICLCIFLFAMVRNGFLPETAAEVGMIISCCVVGSVIICGITAIQSCLTEQGIDGQNELVRYLEKPEEYYG